MINNNFERQPGDTYREIYVLNDKLYQAHWVCKKVEPYFDKGESIHSMRIWGLSLQELKQMVEFVRSGGCLSITGNNYSDRKKPERLAPAPKFPVICC